MLGEDGGGRHDRSTLPCDPTCLHGIEERMEINRKIKKINNEVWAY